MMSDISNEYFIKTNLHRKYSFETFVKGRCNEFAYDVAFAVANAPGKTRYNPLLIHGGVGLGKTHLLHSIGNYVSERNPGLNVIYISAENFTNEFIRALTEGNIQNFKTKYREADLLLIDDMQFLAGKEETQKELLYTFNDLYGSGKQIVISSIRSPKELMIEEEQLASRFNMGLTVTISKPEREMYTEILEKMLYTEQLNIPKKIKEFILTNYGSNVRDMEGALNKIIAYSQLTTCPEKLQEEEGFKGAEYNIEEILDILKYV